VIREVLDRYADICDGIQLDFSRHPLFYRPGQGEAHAPEMTALMAEVRQHLDALARVHSHPYFLLVRLPTAFADYRWAGIDVDEWIARRLVDAVFVAQSYSTALEIPIVPLVERAHARGVGVYVSVFPRSAYTNAYPLVANPSPAHYADYAKRVPGWGTAAGTTVPLIRAAVANYRRMGADGFEMFNLRVPLDSYKVQVQDALAENARVTDGDRLYAITAGAIRLQGRAEPRQLPRKLPAGKRENVFLYIGENFADERHRPEYVGLRIGLRAASADDSITITLNGTTVTHGRMAAKFTPVGGVEGTPAVDPPTADGYLQIEVRDLDLLRPGENEIAFEAARAIGGKTLEVVDVQLGVVAGAAEHQR
jgi:hypothetical protein